MVQSLTRGWYLEEKAQVSLVGTVGKIVPACCCFLKKRHSDHDISVFTVPSLTIRWCYAAVGVLPVLALMLVAVSTVSPPPAVSDGPLNEMLFMAGIALFVVGLPVVVACYIANTRKNDKKEYIRGGLVSVSAVVGILNLLNMIVKKFPGVLQ